MRSGACARPAAPVRNRVADIAFAVMQLLGLPVSSGEQEILIREEARFQSVVRGISLDQAILDIRFPSLQFRNHGDDTGSSGRRPLVLQLFWASAAGLDFRELDSCRVTTPASQSRRTVRIKIPAGLPGTAKFRIDLSDQPGLARLFGMRILGEGDNMIWEWDGASTTLHAAIRHDMEILAVPIRRK